MKLLKTSLNDQDHIWPSLTWVIQFMVSIKWSWSWSYGSWIYNYLCNQCLLPLRLWVRILLRRGILNTTLCDKVCQWLATGWWFSPGTSVSSTNKTDSHDITEILLKVALNTINQTKPLKDFPISKQI